MSILLAVGKVSKLFGLDGGVIINLYDTFRDAIDNEEPLFVKIDRLTVPLFMESLEHRGKHSALVRFADIDNAARAGELIGMEIFMSGGIPADTAPNAKNEDEDEGQATFLEELTQFTAVISENGGDPVHGTVTGFIDSEMNPLFSVDVSGREILIPAAAEFVSGVDTNSHTIFFNIPEGLLELV